LANILLRTAMALRSDRLIHLPVAQE
jgi:hypothetical protein